MSEERQMILKMLKEGKITVEEAEALIDVLSEEVPASASGPAPSGPETVPVPPPWAGSLGEEIRDLVRNALEGLPPAEKVGRSMREFVHELFGLSSSAEDIEVTQTIAPGGRLILRNRRGDVRIGPGESNEIRVRARKQVWSRTAEEARALLSSLRVVAALAGPDVVVEVIQPEGRPVRSRVDMTVEVPEGIAAEVDVRSGDVSVEGLTGDLDARITSGDLTVGQHRGSVRAGVRSGDVKVEEADSLDLQVTSGDVEAGPIGGSAQVRATSGDVSLGEVRGALQLLVQSGDLRFTVNGSDAVQAKVLSGDVDARLETLAPGARVNVQVLAGDLDLQVGRAIRAELGAEVTAGDLDVDLPLQNLQRSRRRIEGIINAPDARIELRVLSGDLSVGPA